MAEGLSAEDRLVDEDDSSGDELPACTTAKPKPKSPYTVITMDQVIAMMNAKISDVESILQIPRDTIRKLLDSVNWDQERLFEKLYGDDQTELFRKAHVVDPNIEVTTEPPVTGEKICDICIQDVSEKPHSTASCGHWFCNECWSEYLEMKLFSEISTGIVCPSIDCDIYVDDETVSRVVSPALVESKHKTMTIRNFVERNRQVQPCSNAACMNFIQMNTNGSQDVQCVCGTSFCFGCGDCCHEPINCAMKEKWIARCSRIEKIIEVFKGKDCPSCGVTIIKEGGCNHITCKKCREKFCWICLKAIAKLDHFQFQSCKLFDFRTLPPRPSADSESDALRFKYYFKRYGDLMTSKELETHLRSLNEAKLAELRKRKFPRIEYQYLEQAVETFFRCRRTLMYSYVFAYYLAGNNHSQIFENNQKDLERFTGKLNGYLANNNPGTDVFQTKPDLERCYRYCESRRKAIVEHVKSGYENQFWKFID